MFLEYDPLNPSHKSVRGGVIENTSFTVRVFTNAQSAVMRFWTDDGEFSVYPEKIAEVSGGKNFYFNVILSRGLYFYRFEADGCFFCAADDLTAVACDLDGVGKSWQLTVYPADYDVPEWIKGGVIYQIFPDRFCKEGDFSVGFGKEKRCDWGGEPKFADSDGKVRNNEFFGGNFAGITSKMDYLASLGVTAIYLNPIFSAYSSHRYDTSDYLKIDEVLGGDEAFEKFLAECEKRGVRVIIDGVFNHVGAGSRYFNKYGEYGDDTGAYRSKSSPYYEWFTFTDYPDGYESWWGFKNLPSVNKNCPNFQNFIAGEGGVLDKYLKAGVSGVRLDVADELTDEFIAKIHKKLSEYGQKLLIGEVWEDATNKVAYGVRRKYFSDGELHSVMNYPLRNAIIDYAVSGECERLNSVVREQLNNYPKPALDALMNSLSTHDTVRIINALGRLKPIASKGEMAHNYLTPVEYERGKKRLKICAALQYFLYGVPSVYYGDEAGLQGDLDPYNRRCYNWENPDNELIALFSAFSQIRKNFSALKAGECDVLISDDGLFGFSRSEGGKGLAVFTNLRFYTRKVFLNASVREITLSLKGKGERVKKGEIIEADCGIEVPPESFKIVEFGTF